MTKEKKILLCLLSVLFLLCTGLRIADSHVSKDEAVVENRLESLYDASRIPEIPAGGDININTADAALLATLPGIGETLAARIVAHREEWGPFPHPASITEVDGIGEKTYAQIQDKITIK